MHVLHLARAGTSVHVVRVCSIHFNQMWSDRHRNDSHRGRVLLIVPQKQEAWHAMQDHTGKHQRWPEHREGRENVGKSVYCRFQGREGVRQSKQAWD